MTLKRYAQIVGIYIKMDLASLMRDTGFMIVCIISDLCANISLIAGVFLLAWKFDGIGGLNRGEVLFMLAFGNIVMGILTIFMGSSNALYPSRIIGRGQWEHMFIIPLPYIAQLTSGLSPFTCSGKFISGAVLLTVAVNNLNQLLSWWWFIGLLIGVIVSIVIILAISYLISTLAFIAPVQCEEISSIAVESLEYTSTYPLSGMPLYIKIPLLAIFPAGLIAWMPTMIILGKVPVFTSFYILAFAGLVSILASYFFKKGFRLYVQKGINRYTAGGHR
jgi:ABC-2 type transport system permease protein